MGQGVLQTSVDPDIIPPGMLERVDVIPDGGSSIYGSDAIGGVINFITRKRFNGLEATAHYGLGDSYHTFDANATAGKDWGTGSLVLSLPMPGTATCWAAAAASSRRITARKWNETPYSCKPLGDADWAKGVNQLTCHVWACRPWTDAAHEPGMMLGNSGVFLSRANTWFAMAKPWFDYLRRGQAMLQQGRPVVDIAGFLGEDIPMRAHVPSTPLPVPQGYQFDSLNPDALLTIAQVRDGWIVLPRAYRSTPAMLRRIARLVSDEATVIGAPFFGTLGLEGGGRGQRGCRADRCVVGA